MIKAIYLFYTNQTNSCIQYLQYISNNNIAKDNVTKICIDGKKSRIFLNNLRKKGVIISYVPALMIINDNKFDIYFGEKILKCFEDMFGVDEEPVFDDDVTNKEPSDIIFPQTNNIEESEFFVSDEPIEEFSEKPASQNSKMANILNIAKHMQEQAESKFNDGPNSRNYY